MAKSFETTVEIKGAIGSSFTDAFRKANSGLVDLRTEAKAVQQELNRLGRDFREGKIHQSQFADETRKLAYELNALERAQQKQLNTQQRMQTLQSQAHGVWNNTKAFAGVAAVTTATAASAAIVSSINTAADFEAQMAKVGAKTSATDSELQKLSQTAISLGASTSLSASEVAQGMDELAAKGMNVKDIIAAIPGMIAGAESSGESLETVSSVVTSAINAYGMSASEAGRVSDIMAMSANNSAAGVLDLGYSFKYAAPIAKTLGIRLEELSAATGILVDKGLQGEQAGTSLRMALTRLSDPPKEAQKALQKLGITAVDANDEFKSLTQIAEEWNKATKDLTASQKVQYASTVFGTEAATAMLSLFDAGPSKINEMTKALQNSGGTAEQVAKQMKDNFAGAREQLFGAIDSAKIAFATPTLPVLQDTFDGLTSTIENNLSSIENAGKAVADVLKDITAPFSTTEPIKPIITPNMDPTDAQNAVNQYYKDLEKYELFSEMDFGDKIDYMLDETGTRIEAWIDGEGGEVVSRVFSEFGTLAGKAWLTSFTTAATGAVSELMQGNVAGALGMGVMANMMTGGMLLTGGLSAGKWALDKGIDMYSNRKSKKAIADDSSPTIIDSERTSKKDKIKESSNNKKVKGKTKAPEAVLKNESSVKESAKSSVATRTARNAASKGGIGKALTKFGKIGGKAFLPLSLLASAADIATSKNKSKAVGSAVGSTGGGLAGAAAGAAIGSVVPIIGTVAGGIIGGIAGGLGGDWLGGKIGNLFGGGSAKASAAPAPNSTNASASTDFSSLNSEVAKATQNATLLTQYLGQASGMIYGSIYPLQQQTNLVSNNMSLLASYSGQASGMIYGSFYPLQQQTNLVSNNMSLLASYSGQASGMIYGSFYPLQQNTNLVSNNMSLLASYVGQASGWLATLQGIQPAGQRVIQALNTLEQRINNIELPGTSNRRLSYE